MGKHQLGREGGDAAEARLGEGRVSRGEGGARQIECLAACQKVNALTNASREGSGCPFPDISGSTVKFDPPVSASVVSAASEAATRPGAAAPWDAARERPLRAGRRTTRLKGSSVRV